MGTDEITFQDLLGDEPECGTAPRTFAQLLAEGLPYKAGMAELAAIERMENPGPEFARLREGYRQILALQRRAA
jgi:hypothetical protein